MNIKFYGTRGSIPIARSSSTKYGGNTTCLCVISDCVPKGSALLIDTGSGFVPLSRDLMAQGIKNLLILYTHWHHDHTQGLPLGVHPFVDGCSLRVWGPKQDGIGPQQIFEEIMRPPFFPVAFAMVRHRFNVTALENIGTQVLVIHPKGGPVLVPVNVFHKTVEENRQLSFGQGRKYWAKECLVIWMHRTVHPEYTVSYRVEEMPTGKVFVLLTDHENTDAWPRDLLQHVRGADLLAQDCQYSREHYDKVAAGWGHGTPDYCAQTAIAADVKVLGLVHHDPGASDDDVEKRLREAKKHVNGGHLRVIACADYQEVVV